MKHSFCISGLLVLALSTCVAQRPRTDFLYKDPKAPIPERVRDLIGRMTLEEKVAQLESQIVYPPYGGQVSTLFQDGHLNEAMARTMLSEGIGTFVFLDEYLQMTPGARWGAERRNQLQSWVMKNTRLGIPIMFHGEALHGAVIKGATTFPAAVGLGSTWDPDLIERMFSTVALEARASGNTLVLAPVLDLSRDPRFGRVEEMYSEDPYLTGRMGVAAVRGLQGNSDRIDENHVFATAKHFVHGQPENGTNIGPSDYSERTMRNIFLYPFEQVVKQAHIEAVMPSYNENDGGIPSAANTWLLQQVLRKEWGFKGLTVSDYGEVEELATLHHIATDKAAAGVLAFNSGVDMELPSPASYPSLVNAVRSGKVSERDLDGAVARVLSAKFRTGLFEHPYVDENRAAEEVGNMAHAKIARHVADEAIVLLQNRDNILPLNAAKIRTLAVIGPNGEKERIGEYSGLPPYYISVVDGIRKRAGNGVKVVYAEGCEISEPDTAPNLNAGPYEPPKRETDDRLLKEALETAKSADVIVLALGGNEAVSRESLGQVGPGKPILGDSDTLQLPGRQNELVNEIAKLGKPMVAVLLNGRTYAIDELASKVPGILEGWYLGQETGNAIADVLFGDVNPSGHLPVTIPRNVGQLPVYYYKTPAARRGYVFDDNTPLFPFGLGLSYTTFKFGTPTLNRQTITTDGTARVTVTVTNTGAWAGDEVVQMYIHHPISSVVQPIIMLRDFKRIHLDAGASTQVSFEVGPQQLSILDINMRRTVEAGPVDILIGPSSVETSSVRLTVSQ